MPSDKEKVYRELVERLESLIQGETDEIAILATAACELHQAFDYFDWTGFYRATAPNLLKIGPFQGAHGCLTIPFSRGVCGAVARTKTTQRIGDVSRTADHIACSSTTRSEIVVPLLDSRGTVRAVLDVDSDTKDAFDAVDQKYLEAIAATLAKAIWE